MAVEKWIRLLVAIVGDHTVAADPSTSAPSPAFGTHTWWNQVLKLYNRLAVISTKLPIVKDLIEIFIHASIVELEQKKMVLDKYTYTWERSGTCEDW